MRRATSWALKSSSQVGKRSLTKGDRTTLRDGLVGATCKLGRDSTELINDLQVWFRSFRAKLSRLAPSCALREAPSRGVMRKIQRNVCGSPEISENARGSNLPSARARSVATITCGQKPSRNWVRFSLKAVAPALPEAMFCAQEAPNFLALNAEPPCLKSGHRLKPLYARHSKDSSGRPDSATPSAGAPRDRHRVSPRS